MLLPRKKRPWGCMCLRDWNSLWESHNAISILKALRSPSRKKSVCFTGHFPGVHGSPKTLSKVLWWPQASLRTKSETKTAPSLPGHPLGLLLAWILGWQDHESDAQGTVPLSPFSAGHSVPGTGSGTYIPSLALVGRPPGAFLHLVRPCRRGPAASPPTSGSPFLAAGRGSRGCSGHSPVRSHEAGRSTGRSLGRRVPAR